MPSALKEHKALDHESLWTTAYWMRHCEGFRVVGPRGRRGYVETVELDDDGDVDRLVVGADPRFFVEPDEIASIDTDEELVRLRQPTQVA